MYGRSEKAPFVIVVCYAVIGEVGVLSFPLITLKQGSCVSGEMFGNYAAAGSVSGRSFGMRVEQH